MMEIKEPFLHKRWSRKYLSVPLQELSSSHLVCRVIPEPDTGPGHFGLRSQMMVGLGVLVHFLPNIEKMVLRVRSWYRPGKFSTEQTSQICMSAIIKGKRGFVCGPIPISPEDITQ